MITRRTARQLTIVAAALALGAAIPSVTGDGRVPAWRGAAHWLSQRASHYVDVASNALEAARSHVGAVFGVDETVRLVSPAGRETLLAGDLMGPPTLALSLATLGIDPTGVGEALFAYRAGTLADGDAAARHVPDQLARTALEWVAIRRFAPHDIGLVRLQAFMATHPTWPARAWLARRAEEALLGAGSSNPALKTFLRSEDPQTLGGKIQKARYFEAEGRLAEAARLVKALWRSADLSSAAEARIKVDFGLYLTPADHKFRADRLLYKEQVEPALRAAAAAGPDILALARARVAVINNSATDATFATLPASVRTDPGAVFAQIQRLRRADHVAEAATLMLSAPGTQDALVNGDEWWTERRLLARKMLDAGDARTAYVLCAEHSATSPEARIEAEFHAGWIALRFLADGALAEPHFAAAAALAETPMSISRAAYWQGRAVEASLAEDAGTRSQALFQKAAAYDTTYYGQLARDRLVTPLPERSSPPAAEGDRRDPAIRTAELLDQVGETDIGSTLAIDAARSLVDLPQARALAQVVAREHDAHLSLSVGKLMSHRGLMVEALAYPTEGVPDYDQLRRSADRSVVLAVARQESAFDPHVVSAAGAKGLMQMMTATARHTAELAGLAFDDGRLLADAAFNAQLGAAHLGTLLDEQGGSFVLTFAAYNAGGGRVKQWVAAYGNPTQPGVDPIDWVERIPFTETRNYVQRCIENLVVYRRRLQETTVAGGDLRPRQQARL